MGTVISVIPWTFFGSGCMPWALYSAPKKVTLSLQSSSFLLFSTNPYFWQTFRRMMRLVSWSSSSTPKITMSSCIPITPGHCSSMASIHSWNTSWLILAPNGILRKQNHPNYLHYRPHDYALFIMVSMGKKSVNISSILIQSLNVSM